MRNTHSNRNKVLFTLALALLVLPLAGAVSAQSTPARVNGILYAQPFEVEQAFPYDWNADDREIDSGWIVVLDVDPELVKPRQVAEPVLFVGTDTAQKVNIGYHDGRLIALVPGDLDLEGTTIWFGTPRQPAVVDSTIRKMELQIAANADIQGISAEEIQQAILAGGETLRVKDEGKLQEALDALTARFAPKELKSRTTPSE